jgi:tetratricopeptide (TPR) repeat protein
VSVSIAEVAAERFDPIYLLMSHSTKASKDANAPNSKSHPPAIKPPAIKPSAMTGMQVVELPSARQDHKQNNPDCLKIAPVNFAARIDEKSSKENFIIAPNPQTLLTRKLWRQRITFAEDANDQRSKNELRRIIEQIRSVEFDPQSETVESVVSTEPALAAKPLETLPDSERQATQSKGHRPDGFSNAKKDMQSTGPLPYRTITDQTLQMLEDDIAKHPEKLSNPFELAEVLFISGHPKPALACYRQALQRKEPDDARSAQDRAWILFQIANCLRDVDRPSATKTYRQLIAEYPDSPWTELAKAQDKLVDWLEKDKPASLIIQAGLKPNNGASNMEYAAGG